MADSRAECFFAGAQPFRSPQPVIQALLENNVADGDSTLTSREPLSCRSLHWEDDESTQAKLFKLSSSNQPPNALKEFIKNRNVDFNTPHGSSGVTALMCACTSGHHDNVKLLLKKGANPAIADSNGFNSLHCAVWGKNLKCVKPILSKDSSLSTSVDQWNRNILHHTALGDLAVYKFISKKYRVLLESRDEHERTVLHWAVLSKQLVLVKFVLGQTKAPLRELQDKDGATALHYAMTTNSTEIAQLLLTKGCDPLANDSQGFTPLHWASVLGDSQLVECLLQYGAAAAGSSGMVTVCSTRGLSALHCAASVGSVAVCEHLLSANAMINSEDSEGMSALHRASRFGHTDCVRTLLSHDATISTLSHTKRSCLHLAAEHDHSEVTEELISHGVERDQPIAEPPGNCSVHLAALAGHVNVLDALLRNGCSTELTRVADHRTALHLSAAEGHLSCCKLLIEKGAQLNNSDSTIEQLSPLDLALLGDHQSCIQCLIASGARTTGGLYHRATTTIQLSWKFFVHKRRVRIARHCAVLVLQHSIRVWLRRRKAQRLRRVRERRQHEAAQIIQNAWLGYSIRKKAFEESCAALRMKIDKERTATRIILSELQQQTTQTHLPPSTAPLPPPPRPAVVAAPPVQYNNLSSSLPPPTQHFSPSKLLRSSLHTSSTFPASSLVFRERPRKPLSNPTHRVKLDSTGTSSSALISVVGTPMEEHNHNPEQDTAAQSHVRISSSTAREHRRTVLPPLELGKPLVAKSTIPTTNSASIISPTTAVVAVPTISTTTSTKEASKSAVPNKLPHLIEEYESDHLSSFIATAKSRIETERTEVKTKSQLRRSYLKKASSKKSPIDQDLLLNQAERFTKLKRLSSLLEEARETQHDEKAGSYGSAELKEQIRATLEEAVRLRAETESIYKKSKVRVK